MQIVQLEEQKLSWKDYWCLVKLIWGNGNTKGIFLLLFALALETITKFEKEFALYFWIFLLMLAGMGLIYMWPYLYYPWKYHAAVKEANRRIRDPPGGQKTGNGPGITHFGPCWPEVWKGGIYHRKETG